MDLSRISRKPAQENKESTSKSFIFAWGNDEFGQLGIGKNSYNPYYATPRYTKYSINVKKINCGRNHTIMKSEGGAAFVFGSNKFGQLGLPPVQSLRTPSLLKFPRRASVWKIGVGAYHSLVYTSERKTLAFGRNNHGQLGTGDKENRRMPTEIRTLTGESCHGLEGGKFHSGFLNQKNLLFMWGKNKYGQLGLNTVEKAVLKPVQLDCAPLEIEAGNMSGFVNNPQNRHNIKKMSLGYRNTMLLLESGLVAVAGDNSKCQISFAGGPARHTFSIIKGLKEIRKVKCTSFLAAGNYSRELFFLGAVPFLDRYIIETNEDVWKLTGYNLIFNWSTGNDYIIINDIKAGVFTCGRNDNGQLGRNSTQNDGFDVVKQLMQVKIKTIRCGYDYVLCELGVKPLHPRDEMLINEMENSGDGGVLGDEEFPRNMNQPVLNDNILSNTMHKGEFPSDIQNSANLGPKDNSQNNNWGGPGFGSRLLSQSFYFSQI